MKNFFYTISKIFITNDGSLIFGVRDTYNGSMFMYSRVSTVDNPKWHAPNDVRSGEHRGPLIPLVEDTSGRIEEVGDL